MRVHLAALVLVLTLTTASAAPEAVTFHRDVLPILQKHCQTCHRTGEIAPMSFRTYAETRPWARSIREAVKLKKMPPWFADPSHGKFENDRSLTPGEIQTLIAWVDGGALEGNHEEGPPMLEFVDGWQIGRPDVVIEMPNAFQVPASGSIDYQMIAIPTGFTEDKWIEAVEIRPGDRAVVHHVVAFAREPGSTYLRHLDAGIPASIPNSGMRERSPDTGNGSLFTEEGREFICTYVPGGDPCRLNSGLARLIKAGSDIIFEVHYTTNGKAVTDRTKIGFVFARQPPRERVFSAVVSNTNLRIPPGESNQRVDARVRLNAAPRVISLRPHMHNRGKSFEYRVLYPNGESEILLKVPRYDFNWQLTYHLATPQLLPKGTVIQCTAHYDNSAPQ